MTLSSPPPLSRISGISWSSHCGLSCKPVVLIQAMRDFFAPNISRAGRIARAVWGVALLVVGLAFSRFSTWACGALVALAAPACYGAVPGSVLTVDTNACVRWCQDQGQFMILTNPL